MNRGRGDWIYVRVRDEDVRYGVFCSLFCSGRRRAGWRALVDVDVDAPGMEVRRWEVARREHALG